MDVTVNHGRYFFAYFANITDITVIMTDYFLVFDYIKRCVKIIKKHTKGDIMWILYALLSAIFAALVSILAKKGLEGINSNLATAIRTFVVLLAAWGIVFFTGKHKEIPNLTGRNWWFLVLSGLATGASWLFYFKALQLGEVSKVAPIDKLSVVFTMILAFIFLGETVSLKTVIGGLLIAAGTLVLVF